jgi:hypothetical protein
MEVEVSVTEETGVDDEEEGVALAGVETVDSAISDVEGDRIIVLVIVCFKEERTIIRR